jgi:hypothetical protein
VCVCDLQQSDGHAFKVLLGDFARGVKVEEVECNYENKKVARISEDSKKIRGDELKEGNKKQDIQTE